MLQPLATFAAQIGSNPLLVQGPGGNISLKSDRTLTVKASGKWLKNALREPIFVEVELGATPGDFIWNNGAEAKLRPSIETSFHALLPHRVVVHVHSLRVLRWAVLQNGNEAISARLDGVAWEWIPYVRPGEPLTNEIQKRLRGSTSVLVLQNHGLIVAADSIEEARTLLCAVEERLDAESRAVSQVLNTLNLELESGFRLPVYPEIHNLALDSVSREILSRGALYPDQAVFIGSFPLTEPQFRFTPDGGVLLRNGISPASEEILRGHALLLARLRASDVLNPLTAAQVEELLHWDAELFRRSQ